MGEQEHGRDKGSSISTDSRAKKERTVESLGWLTESVLMPKKQKAIEGVGASSILELKAQLYRSQQEAKATTKQTEEEYNRARVKPVRQDLYSRKNTGVDARSTRDKLELKAERDGSASYAALEKKAELYEKLARGDLPDEEEKEKYCVDFFQKSLVGDDSQRPENHETPASISEENEEVESDSILTDSRPPGSGRTGLTIDDNEHKRYVREVHEEASQAREKVSTLKVRRQEQEAARRDKLRQAYLRKQLEKLKAANAGTNNA